MPNLAQQAAYIQRNHPNFKIRYLSHNQLEVRGSLQPSARSCAYFFRLTYRQHSRPVIHILSPELEKGATGEKPPHLYSDWSLCLYLPSAWEFSDYEWLNDTIIPWISLWLHYYEDWLVNGYIWNGGGMHPTPKPKKRNQQLIRPSI